MYASYPGRAMRSARLSLPVRCRSSPARRSSIVRGLIGNRILILVDGIRINNAIYRLGPNQYLNTIDIHRVERIEVLRGPGSVLYGSDALGGLINIITRKPMAADGVSAGLQMRLSSEEIGRAHV